METPSSTRRVTRSMALAASSNSSSSSTSFPESRKIEDSEKNLSKSRQRNDRYVLVDITNDSPIVGLAVGGNLETPSPSMARQRGSRVKKTPGSGSGSGEALLRGQVKTLLQKVEEEAELSKLSLESRPFLLLANSPMGLLAPTPANTPQIPNLSGGNGTTSLASETPSSIVEEQLISQVVSHMFDGKNQENSESEKSVITRSLILDFSEKSEVSDASECSSELTNQEEEEVQGVGSCCYMEKPSASTEDDDPSIWSLHVNASNHDDKHDDEEIVEEDYYYYYYYADIEEEEDQEYDDGGLMLDELCEGLNKISVNERGVPKFAGKHTRFVYNSDDELVEEQEEENCGQASSSSNILRLKGLPTPKGKHLCFSEEEEEEGKSTS